MTTATDTTTPTVTPSTPELEVHTDRATLAGALTTVGVGLARRPGVPTLGGVLLDGRDGDLTLTATDLETVATVRVPDAVRTSGRLLIDHTEATKLLAALVKGERKRDADAAPVTVRTTDDGTAVLDVGGYTMPVTTYRAAEFPTLPEAPPAVAEIDRERFTTDARRVLVATGDDDTVPMVMGMQMRITPGTLTLAGTDRYRLAVATLAATTAATEERAVLFPARKLSAALKHCAADRVRLGQDAAGEWVSLTCGTLTVITRPIDTQFPTVEELVPHAAVTARADREALTHATARAAAALEAKKHTARASHGQPTAAQVALTVDPAGSVSLAPVVREHADAVTAPAHPAEVDGLSEPVRVLFTASYLRDALNTLDGDTVTVQLASPTRPVLLTGTDPDTYRHLLMPVRPPRS
ncbi:DNA polymerase III subunit beta [Haloechinothrix sp. YIM 98757]|uniref:DNA polymerase III subunit beta n=1 Tax=Haloechinothrix aidingensis TaxID=2752311 RepID=A0A838ADB3_9PSEU|nr:DNA polymerase III subunit beta [Haloechinothrix aidingensis]MBA0127282.1 DNA polymerase III subunit beta [Haloechinothrix aidingensis]